MTATRPFFMATLNYYTPPQVKERLEERIVTLATRSMAKAIDKEATTNAESRSDVVRRALDLYYAPRPAVITTNDLEGGPLLDVRVACGPPEEAREDAKVFVISKMTGDEMGFDPDSDFFARARGESMDGAGILDEFVVCFSPLPDGREPRFPQIALVAFEDAEGNVRGTVKRWKGKDGQTPVLLDGSNKEFPLPDGTVKAWPIAIAKGVVGSL